MLNQYQGGNKIFASIIDGSIRVRAKEGEEGAVRRDFETKEGVKGVKFEKIYDSL